MCVCKTEFVTHWVSSHWIYSVSCVDVTQSSWLIEYHVWIWLTEFVTHWEHHSWCIYPYGDRLCASKGVMKALQTNGKKTTATHCNTLQLKHTTTHCNCDTLQLQHTATPVNALQRTLSHHTGVWKESWKRNQQKTKKHLDAKKSHQTKMMRQMSKLRGACVYECVTWLVCVCDVTHS